MSDTNQQTTIAAIATGAAKGGIGIIRISGPAAVKIAQVVCNAQSENFLTPRLASFRRFYQKNTVVDEGIVLYFPGPNSFTGEDVIELQGHGGPKVLSLVLLACIDAGATMAAPGEFSQRAFLNDRIDLVQAEAIADLIDATTASAVKAANRSLQGNFSARIQAFQQVLIELRVFVEAAIDFPEEEVDFLAESDILERTKKTANAISDCLKEAKLGAILQEGLKVVILGKPNAGKSSLLNQLVRDDLAIVTDVAGTTRDSISSHVDLDGVPLQIVDTAGLHDTDDQVEKIGIQRSWQQAERADHILVILDATNNSTTVEQQIAELFLEAPASIQNIPYSILANKADLCENQTNTALDTNSSMPILYLSALTGYGIDRLRTHLKNIAGMQEQEASFTARQRHVHSLQLAEQEMQTAIEALVQHQAPELMAENLRVAQQHLGEITGEFTADDLLGEIFSNFCIGK